jgi:soluble lytic murein transglycosylase-like protein
MLSTMRKAFQDEDAEDSGFGGDIFKSMMDEQLSLALSKSGGIGLASILEKALGIETGSALKRPGKEVRISPVRVRDRYWNRNWSAAADGVPAEAASAKSTESKTTESKATGPGGILRIYDSTIRAASQVFNVSADLIRAVIMQESGGDAEAVSHKGAKGLMQLTDPTARELGVKDPFDPVQNIFGGTRFLAKMLKAFKGNIELALASYNAGAGAVRRYGGIPPYKETQNYVESIVARLEALRTSRTE